MTAECCESFAGTDMRGETIPDSRSGRAETSSAEFVLIIACEQIHAAATAVPRMMVMVMMKYV